MSANAHNNDPSIHRIPMPPAIKVPGINNISTPNNKTPKININISSGPANPATYLLKKTISKSAIPKSPKTPNPGFLNSIKSNINPSPNNYWRYRV